MFQNINPELYKETSLPQRILLDPDPSIVDPRILKAMSTPLVGHLDPEFVKMMDRTKELLRYAFQTKNELTLPVSGTGSASMEAAVANMIKPGTTIRTSINYRSVPGKQEPALAGLPAILGFFSASAYINCAEGSNCGRPWNRR
jgi:hypothetical protein